MSMVALPQRIASTYVVVCGAYGDGTRQAQERPISRQAIYRQSQRIVEDLEGAKPRAALAELQERVGVLEAQALRCNKQLSQAVVLTPDGAAAIRGDGGGAGREPGGCSVLVAGVAGRGRRRAWRRRGRWTKEAGTKAAALPPVLDALAQTRVRQASADEDLRQGAGVDGGGTGKPVLDGGPVGPGGQRRSVERGSWARWSRWSR